MAAFSHTSLCPAGHLPLKGGDQPIVLLSPISIVLRVVEAAERVISPLEGEMSGRTEGDAKEHNPGGLFSCMQGAA